MGPIVFCPNGHIFESGAISIKNSYGATFEGSKETCPVCGAMAEVMEGTFDFVGDVIRVVAAPDITVERLRALQGILENSAGQSPEQVVEEVKKKDWKLGKALATLVRENPKMAMGLASLLLSVISVVLPLVDTPQASLSQAQIEQIIRGVIAAEHQPRVQAGSPTPPSPAPPKPQTSRPAKQQPPLPKSRELKQRAPGKKKRKRKK